MKAPLKERLLARGEWDGGCLRWVGAHIKSGYGHIGVEGKARSVHRVSYEVFKGPIPEGLEIDHLCHVCDCFNPEHLEAVTRAENIRRSSNQTGVNMRKTHCKHEFSEPNTLYSSGGRICRTCRWAWDKARREKKRAEKNA